MTSFVSAARQIHYSSIHLNSNHSVLKKKEPQINSLYLFEINPNTKLCNRLYISKFRLLPIYFRKIKLTQIYIFFFSDYFLQDAVLLDLEAFPWENKAYVFLAYFFVSYHVPMPVSIWFLFLLFISFLFPPIFILFCQLVISHLMLGDVYIQVSRVQGRRNGGGVSPP